MCLFIYTLPQHCGHTYFQNVAECPVARGLAPTIENRRDSTLSEPKFLFDTARSRTHTPEVYARRFPACKKGRAVRPVPAFCDKCIVRREKEEREAKKARKMVVEEEEDRLVEPRVLRTSGVGRSESSGSLVALAVGGIRPSASSTSSSLNDTSGMSTVSGRLRWCWVGKEAGGG